MRAWFQELSLGELLGLLAAVNAAMVLASHLVVKAFQRALPERLLNQGAAAMSGADLRLLLLIAALNTLAGAPGWWLWRRGVIDLRGPSPLLAVADLALLLLWFDLLMYGLHRLMHTRRLYPLSHARHHRHLDVAGLSLFVMSPLEAVGFAALLLLVLALKPIDLGALLAFLLLNWLYGTIGHSGVRFESRLLRWVAGDSSFHHAHHRSGAGNFGFFTPLWDRLLGTELAPGAPVGGAAVATAGVAAGEPPSRS